MTFSYGSNTKSLASQTQLQKTTCALATPLERLSSGLRINSAKDDPGGLALADSLRADAKLASVAVRNANDGLSVTSIVDGALGEISNILTRMAELANQSANGVYAATQRSVLDLEYRALAAEINRISRSTKFNDINLLSNSSNITLQVGIGGNSNSQIVLSAVSGMLSNLGFYTEATGELTGHGSGGIFNTTNAAASLDLVKTALNIITTQRGTIGAVESRLNFAIEAVHAAKENFLAAEGRIRDADIAKEVAELTGLQVIQQAGVAILAQANLQPQVALGLLQ